MRAVERMLAENRPPRTVLDACTALMRSHPRRAEPRVYAGIALARMGERDASLRFLGEAAELAKKDAGVQRTLGQVYAELGDLAAAEGCLRRAADLDPGDFHARFALGVVYERRETYPQAEDAYRRAVDLGSGAALAPAWVGLGNARREQGRAEEAAASYREAAAADPRHAPAFNNLGNVLRELGRWGEAEEAYRTAVREAPGHQSAWANLAAVLGEAGRHEEGAAAWKRAADLAPRDVDAWFGLGAALQRAGRPGEAVSALEHALGCVTPDRPRVISLLGRLHAALAIARLRAGGSGEGATALAGLDAYLDRRPGDATTLAAKAVVLNELGRTDEARALTDPERLTGRFRIDPSPDYPNLERFNEALARHVERHPTLAYAPPHNATRLGMHSGELVTEPVGPAAFLKSWVLACIERYAAELEASEPGHFLLEVRPPDLVMRMWGVVMHAGGHQIPHIHPAAWLSGVYYPEVPDFVSAGDPEHRGWIEFGRPSKEDFPDIGPMPADAIRPEEGLLIIFPAWFYHRTVPYPANARRISVAFDLVPASAPDFGRLLDPSAKR